MACSAEYPLLSLLAAAVGEEIECMLSEKHECQSPQGGSTKPPQALLPLAGKDNSAVIMPLEDDEELPPMPGAPMFMSHTLQSHSNSGSATTDCDEGQESCDETEYDSEGDGLSSDDDASPRRRRRSGVLAALI
eukprot:TRINITY_DN20216_c0_g1_i1.p2 TRINITY_DN20216_c0_g1~~TRINITY_DN20216_c0_g1_i1.p2  ORF type:complete len:134 (+),score=30.42 TRINITY_DN20216_c0_g1_i1:146-547(+)